MKPIARLSLFVIGVLCGTALILLLPACQLHRLGIAGPPPVPGALGPITGAPEAERVEARFKKVWDHADIRPESTCLCQPGV